MSSDPLDDFFAKKDRAKNKLGKKSAGDKVKSDKSKRVEKDPTAAITIKPLDNVSLINPSIHSLTLFIGWLWVERDWRKEG